ncbi:amidohydrolase family protein [Achromobacter sp. Marseille-Q0513]|uniref:metal-dependent hydrolase family protein n=1 Tax=Achromobacter sp. Marseille-Q0513 TaxID=2829161 RepID=UPI001B9C8FD3|nr:amidohydrolase family protein [Achromobacter sp. Marseille-Q0513]MBR8654175.1 amidohydrolase family protein [Achromobacter sp. Marseille-Q0513]
MTYRSGSSSPFSRFLGPLRARQCACHSAQCQRLHQRVTEDLSRRHFLGGMAAMLAPFALPSVATAAAALADDARPLLLTKLRLFDGSGKAAREGIQVLVKGKRIADLLPASATVEGARVLDCQGKLLLPGLIDVHWHTMLAAIPQVTAMTADLGYLYLVAAKEAQRTLMRGFTSVRDAGGPAFALKRAIDEGLVDGPRIYPSGAMISQTSGHGDFRLRSDLPRADNAPLSLVENTGVAMIADGEAQVLRRVREQLMLGASQIKMLAGGGVASLYDPLDSTQFTERELRAGVEAASDWNTYVMTHVYTPKGIQRAIHAGVKCIEHGQLADEASVRLMRDQDVWWSLQPFLQDEDSNAYPDAERQASQKQVAEGTVQAYALAQKHGVKTGWGTDILFNPRNTATQGRQLAKLTRFYDPLTLLGQATGVNGELLALSGERNPYPGALGRIAPGAWADLLVADGDPSANLDFLADPDKNLRLIMKDGKVHKNTL